jgi:hypothetical protein
MDVQNVNEETDKYYTPRFLVIDQAGKSVIFLHSYWKRFLRSREILVPNCEKYAGEGIFHFPLMLLAN